MFAIKYQCVFVECTQGMTYKWQLIISLHLKNQRHNISVLKLTKLRLYSFAGRICVLVIFLFPLETR